MTKRAHFTSLVTCGGVVAALMWMVFLQANNEAAVARGYQTYLSEACGDGTPAASEGYDFHWSVGYGAARAAVETGGCREML